MVAWIVFAAQTVEAANPWNQDPSPVSPSVNSIIMTPPAAPSTPAVRSGFEVAAMSTAHYSVQAANASFGLSQPGVPNEIRDALVIRVFSEDAWVLKLTPRGPSAMNAQSDTFLTMARLAWRSGMTNQYQSLLTAQPIILRAGGPTGPAGTEVRVDLRLTIDDADPVAALALELGIVLESR